MGAIKIGNNVAIGLRTSIYTLNHDYSSSLRRAGECLIQDVIIKDSCWIGANVVITPGSVINEGVVVAAGSVVKGELLSNSLYAGVPAKFIKKLQE